MCACVCVRSLGWACDFCVHNVCVCLSVCSLWWACVHNGVAVFVLCVFIMMGVCVYVFMMVGEYLCVCVHNGFCVYVCTCS